MPSIVRSRVALILGHTLSQRAPAERPAAPPSRKKASPRRTGYFKPWSFDEMLTLTKLCANRVTYEEIGAIMGRSGASVSTKAIHMGLGKPRAGRA